MNIRSLTRGDGAVIGAAVLLLIASFLPFFSMSGCSGDDCTISSWHTAVLPVLPTVHLAGLIAAGLFVAARFLPAERRILGLGARQWGVALAVFAAWAALWSMFSTLWFDPSGSILTTLSDKTGLGYGAWLSLVFALALLAAVLLADRPPLRAPLLKAARPAQSQGFAAQPFGPGPGRPNGYGYPGGQAPAYGTAQPGSPISGGTMVDSSGPAPHGDTGPTPEFAPFWFAVPVARPLYAEDGSAAPAGELTPGTWYLAVDQHGAALVAQTQDGRRGVLRDATGIQRG